LCYRAQRLCHGAPALCHGARASCHGAQGLSHGAQPLDLPAPRLCHGAQPLNHGALGQGTLRPVEESRRLRRPRRQLPACQWSDAHPTIEKPWGCRERNESFHCNNLPFALHWSHEIRGSPRNRGPRARLRDRAPAGRRRTPTPPPTSPSCASRTWKPSTWPSSADALQPRESRSSFERLSGSWRWRRWRLGSTDFYERGSEEPPSGYSLELALASEESP
jgi:hypothetical protein